MSDRPVRTFIDAVLYCYEQPELVAQYERLSGRRVRPPPRSALEKMIDDATGNTEFDEAEVLAFAAFVMEFVWLRLPPAAFEES